MLLIAVAAAIGVPLAWHRFDDEVRRRVEAKIAEHYPALIVSVRSARFSVGKGIEIRGLSIVEPNVSGPTAELVYVEELFLEGDTEWQELLQGELRISRVVFRRPTLRIAHRPDGSWSAAKLLPLPRLSKDPPRGTFENGVIEILDPLKQQGGSLIVRDAQLDFEPAQPSAPASAGSIAAEAPAPLRVKDASGDAYATKDAPAPLRVYGHFGADHIERVEVDATLVPSGAAWSVTGNIDGLDFSPEFVRALPAVLSRRLAEVGSLRCEVQGRFRLARAADAQAGLEFDVRGQLNRGRIDDPRLPYPLTDLRAAFHADNQALALTDVTARNGQTTLALELHRQGYVKQSPYTLLARSRRMVFDKQLRSILPLDWQCEWHKLMPAGEFDADFKLVFDGRQFRPELTIVCKNASFSYYKFPYRLERTTGRVELIDRLLKLDLKAFSEGEEVRIFGEFRNPGPQAVGRVNVSGDNIRLDEKLFLALSDGGRRIVRSLNPRGTFNVAFDLWHGGESPPRVHKKLSLSLNRCSLRYEPFPYPLDNIRGTIAMEDDVWDFKDLEGTNDTATVECHGRLVPRAAGHDLSLHFYGKAIALEDELRDALAVQSAGAARFWHDLHPRGFMNVDAVLHCPAGQRKPEVAVTLQPLYGSDGNTAVSIEPTHFPYRLEKVRGIFRYEKGKVTLENVRAEHRGTRLSAAAECLLDGEGGWQLVFQRLEVERLRADRDLVQALSGGLKRAVTELSPRGPMNVRGTLGLANNGRSTGLTAQWNVSVEAHQLAVDCGIELENIFGAVRLWGSFDGQRFVSNGELSLDSMTYKNFQFTECLGPFWLDDRVARLGRDSDRQRGTTAGRPITARLYGGTIMLGGRVDFGPRPRYSVYATLAGADLARCAQEAIAGKQRLSGLVSAEVDLHGTGRGIHHLGGRGSVELRDAKVFELPVMLALLKTLGGRLPDTTAFNTADVDFRIEGDITQKAVFPNVEEAVRLFQTDTVMPAPVLPRGVGRAAAAPQTR
ncbi:MAG: hypothetical protein B7Z73_03840 [Planctomycetia bacterium 21-64-5]|nr:MAG: hypothetical protein B7Z73_03840 [Planctomycetia bacterium 21-64-5]